MMSTGIRAMNAVSLGAKERQNSSRALKKLEAELQSHERRSMTLNALFKVLRAQCDLQTILLEDLETELQSKEGEMGRLREEHSLPQSQHGSQTEQLEDLEAELQSKEEEMGRLREEYSLPQSQHYSQTLEKLEAELQSNGGRPRILNALFKILSTQCEVQIIRLEGLEARIQSKEEEIGRLRGARSRG